MRAIENLAGRIPRNTGHHTYCPRTTPGNRDRVPLFPVPQTISLFYPSPPATSQFGVAAAGGRAMGGAEYQVAARRVTAELRSRFGTPLADRRRFASRTGYSQCPRHTGRANVRAQPGEADCLQTTADLSDEPDRRGVIGRSAAAGRPEPAPERAGGRGHDVDSAG